MFSSIIRNEIWNSGLISTLASPGSKRANEGVIYSKNLKITFCQFFSPDFNSQIRLFYAEKWNFLKKLGPLLDVFFPKVQVMKEKF